MPIVGGQECRIDLQRPTIIGSCWTMDLFTWKMVEADVAALMS